MGKGDPRTKRGKIFKGTSGKYRVKKKDKPVAEVSHTEPVEEMVEIVEKPVKKAAEKKPVEKKPAEKKAPAKKAAPKKKE